MPSRRQVLGGLASVPFAATCARAGGDALRIGYQKSGPFIILREQRRLETALGGVDAAWMLFQSGPPMLEAMNAGSIDLGATGNAPPVFAQAAGIDLVYVGAQPISGANAAILVHADSPIRTVADLRGRRIALTKASSAHYQTVRTLETAGLTLKDVQPVFMQPADATAAFRSGAVDAWTIWDPFYAIAERDPSVRVLVTGEVAPSNNFFLARRDYAVRNPGTVVTVIQEINAAAQWSREHQDALAQIMSEVTGVDLAAQKVAAARDTYGVQFMNDSMIAQQQEVADTFANLGVLPGRVDVRSAVWLPPTKSANAGAKQ